MSVTTNLYRGGIQVPGACRFEDISEVLLEDGALIWVDALEPSQSEVMQIGEEFGLHPLALEDALHDHQRPKIESYDNHVYIVAYGAEMGEQSGIELRELSMFVSSRFVVTIRHSPQLALEVARQRLEHSPSMVRSGGAHIGYAVLDELIDSYFPVVEHFEDRIERAESELLTGDGTRDSLPDAFAIKRDILVFRRAVAPLRDVLGRVVRIDKDVLGQDLDAEYRDLYDHVLRVYDELDTQRDLLTGVLEAHLSVVSNRLNEVVLKLSSWAAIVLVPTLIAGIYGMNFDHMPELHWQLGYPYALGLMLLTGCCLWAMFRRQRWI
ncbi:MAG: magnesium transporter [Gaiellales bacterium]|nr:magnesium transporter [Gaiellales bacterium]MDX6546058.1 magnesium transporter [Gaiellales bacterium]MDX6550995.1 magnesium transporter [Gaiellales bacterium]